MANTTINKDPSFVNAPKAGVTAADGQKSGVTFVNADSTTAKTLFITGPNGAIIETITATTDDTSNNIVRLTLGDTVTDFHLGDVVVTTLAGTDAGVTPSKNLLDTTAIPSLRSDGSLLLPPDCVVKVAPESAVTAAKTLTIFPHAWDL